MAGGLSEDIAANPEPVRRFAERLGRVGDVAASFAHVAPNCPPLVSVSNPVTPVTVMVGDPQLGTRMRAFLPQDQPSACRPRGHIGQPAHLDPPMPSRGLPPAFIR